MQVEVKSSAGTSLIPLQTRHFAKRRVTLRGEINMESACEFSDAIAQLNDASTTEPIDVYISSPGGEVQAGLFLYDIITDPNSAPIRVHGQGLVASIAALIFAAAPYRDLLPNTKMLIHQPLLGNPIRGNASDIRAISEDLLAVRHRIDTLFAQHTGRTLEEVQEKTNTESYFTAQEAVAFGLADKVSSYADMMHYRRD